LYTDMTHMRLNLPKVLVAFFFLVSWSSVSAQQDPYYSHFKFNRQAYNPAAAGTQDDYICLSAVTHSQWRNFDDRTGIDRLTGQPPQGQDIPTDIAPVTYNFNIGGQITTQKGTKPIGAVGLTIYDDKLGFMSTTSFRGQLVGFVPVQGNFGRLAIGLEVGSTQFGFENPAYIALDPTDPKIPSLSSNDSKLALGAGLYYKQRRLGPMDDFYAGFSVTNLNGATYNIETRPGAVINFDMEPHMYFLTGADYAINSNLVLEPAVLLKYRAKLQFDLNATVLWNDMLRGGIGYRQWGTFDAITLMAGYKRGQLQVGYSYDVTISKVRLVSDGTHEIMASWCFQLNISDPPEKKEFYRNTRWL
jgi:type IX secretion system PorP/SprF family membrane protein